MANTSAPQDTCGHNRTLTDIVERAPDGSLTTTSLIVAEKFGKEHGKVLRAIENLECSQEFRQANFGSSNYLNSQGKSMPMVVLTRDGFTFLAMGFTGKEAAEWKEKFIAAFNAMEQRLAQSIHFALPPELLEQQMRTDKALAVLASKQSMFHDETMGRFDRVEQRLDALESEKPRRNFGAPTLRQWNGVIVARYNGLCPCCQSKRIVDQFGRPISGEYEADHWFHPNKNKVSDGWPVCKECNHGILETDRMSRAAAFQHFHLLRKSLFPAVDLKCKQLAMSFSNEDAA